jgi:serine phosphatase RsbU (regulator of sigma subunit)
VGRNIASGLTEEAVIKAVREGALKLLRGEECVVMGLATKVPPGASAGMLRGVARLTPLPFESTEMRVASKVYGDPLPGWIVLLGEMTDLATAINGALFGRALEVGGTVVLDENLDSESQGESAIFGGVRSALCLPVFVRGQIEACLYILHRRVTGLFGEDERRLANFIGTIAGAALENVRFLLELEGAHAQMAEKQRLEKEMEIAAKIQVGILPRNFRVAGLEIAASMIPATEVGGDYYDVQPTSDGCWIGIGDVAGHGLPTGLVMLMIQSVVAALSRQEDAAPSQLLNLLNEVLYENVQIRLQQDEHATLSLLRYRGSGEVTFAGAHEDIVVCRAETGVCESVETPGTWIAAKKNIADVTIDSTLRMRPGDVMLLYTDGVTEARNEAGEMFGTERLSRSLARARSEPVERIVEAILEEVKAWIHVQDDDITLLVARQKETRET